MRLRLPILLLLSSLWTLGGCKKEEISAYRVAKETADPMREARLLPPSPPPAGSRLAWELPKGWKELPASGMRLATFSLQGLTREQADASAAMFPGDAGGVLSNVNRWRGQLGLGPMTEKDLSGAGAVVASPAGDCAVFEFSHQGRRMLGSILSSGGNTWFFKISGEDGAVASAKPAFLRLLRSLHPGA